MYVALPALFALMTARRYGGLVLLILVAVPARMHIGSQPITLFEAAIPLCVFHELNHAVAKRRRNVFPLGLVTFPVLAFYGVALVSGYWAIDGHLWLTRIVVLTEALLCGWAIYLATMRLGAGLFLRMVTWCATVGAAWSLTWFYLLGRPISLNMQPPTSSDALMTQTLRLGSPLLGPSNYYAGFLLLTIPVAFFLAKYSKIYWFCVLIQLATLIATLSRGSSIALLVAIACALFIRNWQNRKLPHGATVAGAGLAALALAPYLSGILSSLLAQRRETTFAGQGFGARQELWNVALNLWKDHPIVGIGEGTWKSAVEAQYAGQAHNVFMQILAELGIVGVLTAGAALTAVFIMTFRIQNARLRFCILVGLLAAFVSCLSEATFEGVVFTWFLGAFLGGFLAASTRDQVRS